MTFGDGEIVYSRVFDSKSGKETMFLSFPRGVTLEEAKKHVAPEIELTDWQETDRKNLYDGFISRLLKEEARDIVFFEKAEPSTTN